MIKLFYSIFVTCFSYLSFGQNGKDLLGTWKFQYSLQPKNKPCNLKELPSRITFKADSSYTWQEGNTSVKGKWMLENGKLFMFNNKAIGFNGTIANSNYPIELNNGILIIHKPEGGDISCPHLHFKKQK